MIEAAIDMDSRKSRQKAGNGTSMTKITLMAAIGSMYSCSRCQIDCVGKGGAFRAMVLTADLLQRVECRSQDARIVWLSNVPQPWSPPRERGALASRHSTR